MAASVTSSRSRTCTTDSISKVLRGGRRVTAKLAYSVARLTDVSIDDLLAGALLSPRTCPHCGRPPDDFADEETVITDRPFAAGRAS